MFTGRSSLSVRAFAAAALTVSVTVMAAQSPAAGEGDPVAFTGQVLSSDPGEQVELRALIWPNQTTLDALPVDTAVPFVPAVLEVYGNTYEVRIDPSAVPASHMSTNSVDVEVVASTADGDFAGYNETVSLEDGAWVRSDAALGEIAQMGPRSVMPTRAKDPSLCSCLGSRVSPGHWSSTRRLPRARSSISPET